METRSERFLAKTFTLVRASWRVLFVVLVIMSGIGLWHVLRSPLDRQSATALPVYGTVPDFQLTERSGQPFARADLAGKIWIANFIFTRCPGVCPLLSTRMAQLQEMLQPNGGIPVRLLSLSVDPAWDTPERLRDYAVRYNADPSRWFFLTGEGPTLRRIISQGFLLAMGQTTPAAGQDQPDIVHSDRFALVDASFRIRGYYRGTENTLIDRLLRDVETLRREHG